MYCVCLRSAWARVGIRSLLVSVKIQEIVGCSWPRMLIAGWVERLSELFAR
jgi:hypothetical protein